MRAVSKTLTTVDRPYLTSGQGLGLSLGFIVGDYTNVFLKTPNTSATLPEQPLTPETKPCLACYTHLKEPFLPFCPHLTHQEFVIHKNT